MDSERTRETILRNAAEIARLHARSRETARHRTESPEKRRAWENASSEFLSRYNQLAFPGGYNGALEKIRSGDPNAMEAAICFLECRPYFFRSGYMFKDILRACRRAPLNAKQSERFGVIEQNLAAWRQRKLEKKLRERA